MQQTVPLSFLCLSFNVKNQTNPSTFESFPLTTSEEEQWHNKRRDHFEIPNGSTGVSFY